MSDGHGHGQTDVKALSGQALWRYLVVSQVLAREEGGQVRADAVAAVAEQSHKRLDGRGSRKRSRATLYRWLAAYEAGGAAALEPRRCAGPSSGAALPGDLLGFVVERKRLDPRVSIPDAIRQARELGVISAEQPVDRSTVWRACRARGVPTRRRRKPKTRDSRRFAYPHRMDMVLCDGKWFRAGPERHKRLAFFFIDDCTRMALHVVVGTSENPELFLRGLHELVRRHGRFSVIYVDNGSAFIAADSAEIVRKLGSHLVLGEAGYPEGRGKIERFNLTAQEQILRHLPGRAEVCSEFGALELRLGHYLREVYNHSPHEGISGATPSDRFHADDKPLRFLDDRTLRSAFIAHAERLVSNDHCVSFEGVVYEIPRGHAGERITLHRRLLEGTLAVLHDGRLRDIHPVDLAANAHSRRGSKHGQPDEPGDAPTMGAADLAFLRSLGPIVGPDGGFSDPDDNKEPS